MLDWLEAIRVEQHLSQKAVSEAAGISQASYCNIEAGKRSVAVKTAKRIAAALGFDWTRFYETDGEGA